MKIKNNISTRILIAYPIVIIAAILHSIEIINTTGYFIIAGIVIILYIIALMRPECDAVYTEGEEDGK